MAAQNQFLSNSITKRTVIYI